MFQIPTKIFIKTKPCCWMICCIKLSDLLKQNEFLKDSDYKPYWFRCILSGFKHVLIFIITWVGGKWFGRKISQLSFLKNSSINRRKFDLKFNHGKFQHKNDLWYFSTISFQQQRIFRRQILHMELPFCKHFLVIPYKTPSTYSYYLNINFIT